VADAAEYVLAIEDGNAAGGIVERTYSAAQAGCSGGGICSVSPAAALAAGLANWRVRAGNSDGPGPWSEWLAFAVCVGTLPPVGTPEPRGPSGAIDTNLPVYRFTPVADATKYFLWVDGPSGTNIQQVFSAAESGCVGGVNDCAVTPSTPVAAGLSNWWVQAQNSGGAGPWSVRSTLVFGGVAPPTLQPTLLAPAGLISTATPTYRWNPVPAATRYELWVDDASGTRLDTVYTAAEVGCDAGGTCEVTPPAALVPGLGKWWVQAENTMGDGPWSAGTVFTVSGGPPAPAAPPTLIAPLGAILTPTPSYSWNSVADATEYYLWVTDHGGIRIQDVVPAVAAGCASGGVCTVTPSTAVQAGLSRWWVRAQNSGGTSEWSAEGSFNVGGGSPPVGTATLLAPLGSADSATPTYEWTAVSGATEYLLWVSDAGDKERVVRVYSAGEADCADGTCSVTPDTKLAAGVVTWWIQAQNASGAADWSEGASFAFCGTAAMSAAPALIAPSGASSAQPTYEWSAVSGATDYFLWVNHGSTPLLRQLVSASAAGCAETGSCSATPATALPAGACRFWVRAQNSMGPGPWSTAMTFSSDGS
jgi:hypothetical protein